MNPQHPHHWAGHKRWEKVEDLSHEFYNLGHLLEGAIAHYQATGKRNFLDIAIRYADCVERSIGDKSGQVARVPGHQIAEMGLAKLYVVTGEKKYLDLAKYFLDKRGYTSRKDAYSQAHKPILEQDEAVGHAVRAGYMYSGIADVAALTGDTAYNETCAAIANVYWNYRLFLLHGEAKYFDVMERTLYNGLISGVSLDGGTFFYPNPLEFEWTKSVEMNH